MLQTEIFIPSIGENVLFLIGKNAIDNFAIIDASVNPNDIWFHIKGVPSGHVIAVLPVQSAKITGKNKNNIITQGAVLCKQHSKYKSDRDVPIVYTEIKNLQKGSSVGSVYITNERIKYI
jgi:predicted ribosome quality control (RQC) complex YloA/Tae2 family protein